MKRYSQVAAFVLAGGASSRMGRDKGLLEIAGVPLIVRTVCLVEPLVDTVTIVGAPESYCNLGLRVIADQDAGEKQTAGHPQGSLAGIASALAATSAPWNLILACDLPYLTHDWLNWLIARAMHSQAQILLPRTPRGLEPLSAVYRRECAIPIAGALARGVRKVTDALAGLEVQTVDAREWRKVDPDGRVLINMNSPADYDDARTWWEAAAMARPRKPKMKRKDEAPHRHKQ